MIDDNMTAAARNLCVSVCAHEQHRGCLLSQGSVWMPRICSQGAMPLALTFFDLRLEQMGNLGHLPLQQ